jgi:hypothetical protein
MEGLLPRATIYTPCALRLKEDKGGQMTLVYGYVFSYEPGQSGTAPASALLFAWTFTTFSLHSAKDFPGSLSLRVPRQSRSARALHLQPLSSWLLSLSLQLLGTCFHPPDTMARKRGRPRRGSAWDAHKAQRRRKEQLERALALATSILRKKARAERMALLATIAEPGAGCSREDTTIKPGDKQEAETEAVFPTCVVEEDPFMGDLLIDEKPRAMETTSREGTKLNLAREDDFPGCIVEEIPWPGDNSPIRHGMQVAGAKKTVDAEVEAVQRELATGIGEAMELRIAPLSGTGGGLHGSLLSAEHLALVFELRGHMADLEHRALLMGQRMDFLLDAFSGAPAQRKCPMCEQAFAILAGTTWQTGEGDRPPGA